MVFRGKDKPCCKGGVAKECTNARNHVLEEEVKGLPTKMDLLTFELWSSWHPLIDDAVELLGIAI
jgi:hypothetical protein